MGCLSSLIVPGKWNASPERKLSVAKWYYLAIFALSTLVMWLLRDYGAQLLAQHMPAYKADCRAAAYEAEQRAAYGWTQQQPRPSPSSLIQQASMVLNLPDTMLLGMNGSDSGSSSTPPPPGSSSNRTSTGSLQEVIRSTRDSVLRRCGGFETVSRLSFAAFCFFAFHFVLLLAARHRSDPRLEVCHAGMWLWRSMLWLGLMVAFLFVPTSAAHGYAQFARAASGIFLVLQLLLLLHALYELCEWLLAKESKASWAGLLGLACVGYGGALALISVSYVQYAPSASCSVNIFASTMALLSMLAMTAILFVPRKAASAGLPTSGVTALYVAWLTYSALASEPQGRCTPQGKGQAWLQIVGFIIAIASLLYSVISTGLASRDVLCDRASTSNEQDSTSLPYRPDFFHLVFALASAYVCMLLANWEVGSNGNGGGSGAAWELQTGWASVWVKLAAAWVTVLLYIWSVVAPAVLPNRDFRAAVMSA